MCPVTGDRSFANLGQVLRLHHGLRFASAELSSRHAPLSAPSRRASPGFIKPCLPSPADKPPSGENWIHEIKHDVIA